MDVLAIKIAELLEISVESAINLYPQLRSQFIMFKSIGYIKGALYLMIAAVIIGGYFIVMAKWNNIEINRWEDDWKAKQTEDENAVISLAKKMLVVLVIMIVITVLLEILSIHIAPDLHLILDFL